MGKRFDRTVVRRLRATATLAIAAVVAVALAQTIIQIYLAFVLPHYDTVVGLSGQRAILVERIARRADPADVQRLETLEQSYNDLTPAEVAVFDHFITGAGHPGAEALSAIFEGHTNVYVERGERIRANLVVGVVVGSVVLLLAAMALYVFALVPTVDGVNRTLRSEERQRERLRMVSNLSFAHGSAIASEIKETLGFASRSLGAIDADVALLSNDLMTIVYAYGDGLKPGQTLPFAGSAVQAIFGSREVLETRYALTTTVFIEEAPAGVLTFSVEPDRARPFSEDDRNFVRIVASFVGSAIERERRESKLSELAYLDPLTRLPNRSYFTERLGEAFSHAQRRNQNLAICYIDLDGFKQVNDTLGHATGDEVLRIAAARMRAAMRDHDVLARVGGDEFVALQVDSEAEDGAERLGQRFIAAASEAMIVGGTTVQIGASVGIARYPQDADNPEDLLARADQAMYAAKRGGKNKAVLYLPEVGQTA